MAERKKTSSKSNHAERERSAGNAKGGAETSVSAGNGATSQKPRARHVRAEHRFAWVFGLITTLLMIVAFAVGGLLFFQVENVTAEGSSRYTNDEIIQNSGISAGDNLFFLNTREVEQSLQKEMPYLKKVTISRSLPGSVKIVVEDSQPVAALEVSSGYWYVDEQGKLLELRNSDNGLPNISGLSIVTPTEGSIITVDTAYRIRLNSMISLLTALYEQELLDNVISIDLSGGSQIIMMYTNKYTVKIPYGTDFSYKVRALNGIVESLAEQNDEGGGVIDLMLEDEWHFIPG